MARQTIDEWAERALQAERKLTKIRDLCNERHEHGDVEGFGKCSVSGFCAILRIIDPPSTGEELPK